MLVVLSLIPALLLGLFYAVCGNDIYDDVKPHKKYAYAKNKRWLKEMPCALKIERFYHRFLGVFVGWLIIGILLERHISIQPFKLSADNLGIADLVLFILGWVGINGRLPKASYH